MAASSKTTTITFTNVFSKNLKEYISGANLIVNQGGTRSSKTYSIIQLLVEICKRSTKPLIISIVSRSLPHLKLGAMRDLDSILESHGIIPDSVKNKTESYYKIQSAADPTIASTIEFFGADDLGKVHGPARDILFVNEANYIKYDTFDQLSVRTRGAVWIDYNPTKPFWYHENIQGQLNHSFIKSTYLDNNFLSREQIERIEAKKTNPYWWRVYGEGELGRLEDAIFTNWEFGAFDWTIPYNFGLDFGVKDPDAMVRVAVDKANKKIYWREELYQSGLSTPQLFNIIKSRGVGNSLIVADSAGAKTILDLKNLGLNIKGVIKPKIVDSIKILWDYKIIVDPESYNLERELNSYVWLDKKGEIPVDEDNHLLDAARYGSIYYMPQYGRSNYGMIAG